MLERAIPHVLDSAADKANGIYYKGERIAPDRFLYPLSGLCCVACLVAFSWVVPMVPLFKLLGLFAIVSCLYIAVFLNGNKRAIVQAVTVSFLQDTLAFILPVSALFIWLLRIPWSTGFNVVGLIRPRVLRFKRIDCFLSGCCFGLPSKYGVHYSEQVLSALPERRRSNPDLYPAQRVFPMQRVEAAANFALFAALFAHIASAHQSTGHAALWYFLMYALYRFIADFFRKSSVRPRYGQFSQAQLLSVGIGSVAGLLLVMPP